MGKRDSIAHRGDSWIGETRNPLIRAKSMGLFAVLVIASVGYPLSFAKAQKPLSIVSGPPSATSNMLAQSVCKLGEMTNSFRCRSIPMGGGSSNRTNTLAIGEVDLMVANVPTIHRLIKRDPKALKESVRLVISLSATPLFTVAREHDSSRPFMPGTDGQTAIPQIVQSDSDDCDGCTSKQICCDGDCVTANTCPTETMIVVANFRERQALFCNGNVSAIQVFGAPAAQRLSKRCNGQIVSLNQGWMDRLISQNRGIVSVRVKTKARGLKSVGAVSALFAYGNLDEQIVYKLAKTIQQASPSQLLVPRSSIRLGTRQRARRYSDIALHSGAAKLFKELGINRKK